ncbi:MAG: putative LPS assembly protein LptD [Chitinophagaceae bacterium]
MTDLRKGKAKYKLGYALACLLSVVTLYAGNFSFANGNFHISLTAQDTIPKNKLMGNDSARNTYEARLAAEIAKNKANPRKDSIVPKTDTFNLKMSKDTLDAPIAYHADDSMILDVPAKRIVLYGKETKVTYVDNELVAPNIEYDQQTNLVKAHLVRDSTGKVISFVNFTQGGFKSINDSIWFNLSTGKGRTKSTYFQQDEMYVQTAISKKVKENKEDVIYARNARFTTCNLDTPHFSFVAGKVKFRNKIMAITGPVHPEIEGVPLPIALPFGIYPLSQGRHSGILAPTFSANEQLGLSLEGLGYYKVLNDNWDATVRGTIYSYGGWTASISPNYYKRYHYRGSLSYDIQRFKYNFKGDPDYSSSRTMNIRWSHSSDTKARPGVTFNANVNAGSSKFNALVPNSPMRNFTNQLNSSITYSKIWKDKPFSLTVSANHNQNTSQKLINLNFPDIAYNINTQYPFRKKEAIGDLKWYENIGIALNSNVKSISSFYDTLGNIGKQLIDKLQWGAMHSVPISLSLPELGHVQIAPSISFQERWYQQKFVRSWNTSQKKVDTAVNKGFYAAREMSFGIGMSTRIFGMYTFGKKSRIQAIRHEIRPSMSISYKPDMNGKSWYRTQVDTFNNTARFSVYDGSIFGGFGDGKFGGISFGIDNNLQMKTLSKKDTGEAAIKKKTLIDGFSINGSYNLMADSFQLSSFNISARTNLFDKISITANAVVDPYQTNSRGDRINKLIWAKKPISLGTLMGGNISLQSQFKGGDKKEKLPSEQVQQQMNPMTGMPLDEYQQEAALIQNNPGQFANFNIPWSVNLSYSLQFSRIRKLDYSGYTASISQNLNWGGTLNLTPKWQLGMNGFYNITEKDLGTISMNISREMHCWQMNINVSPVGRYRFFNISISPKSGLLRDLKINRTRYFYDL